MPVRGNGDPDLSFIAPVVEGTSFDGNPVKITPTGKPTVILFLAHWCPHCQTEVDMLGSWIKDNPIPENVRIVSVAAAIDTVRIAGWVISVSCKSSAFPWKQNFSIENPSILLTLVKTSCASGKLVARSRPCLLYTSDAADE